MVECQLPKLDVAGSTPVSRSKLVVRSATEKRWAALVSGRSLPGIGECAHAVERATLWIFKAKRRNVP